jgi:hypothetical protein
MRHFHPCVGKRYHPKRRALYPKCARRGEHCAAIFSPDPFSYSREVIPTLSIRVFSRLRKGRSRALRGAGFTGRNRLGPAKYAGTADVNLERFRSGCPISNPLEKIFFFTLAIILLVAAGVEERAWSGHKILYRGEVIAYILCNYAKYILTSNCDSLIQICERSGMNASRINVQHEAGRTGGSTGTSG